MNEMRNFKTHQRGIGVVPQNPSLTFRVVISCLRQNRMLFRDCSSLDVVQEIRSQQLADRSHRELLQVVEFLQSNHGFGHVG